MLNDSFLYDRLMQSAMQSSAQVQKEKQLRAQEKLKRHQRREQKQQRENSNRQPSQKRGKVKGVIMQNQVIVTANKDLGTTLGKSELLSAIGGESDLGTSNHHKVSEILNNLNNHQKGEVVDFEFEDEQ